MDSGICQTSTASPAQPGGLPVRTSFSLASGNEPTDVGRPKAALRRSAVLEGGPIREVAQTLVNALADLDVFGVAFVSLRDNLDLSTPSGRLMFRIIGANGRI